MSGVIQVRKTNGISSIQNKMSKKGGANGFFRVSRFSQKVQDRETAGTREGNWNNQTFPRTEQPLMPEYCGVKKQYKWAGSEADFIRLVNSIGMKYRDNYRVESLRGAIIKLNPEEEAGNLENRKRNYMDPIFSNTVFRDGVIMYEGSFVLNTNNPLHEFIYLATKDRLDVSSKDRKRNGSKLELNDLKVSTKSSARGIIGNLKASELFKGIIDDEEKLRQISFILRTKGVSKKTDISTLQIVMHDIIIHNQEFCSAYGKSYQDSFIELCEMDSEELMIQYEIALAISSRIVLQRKDRFEYKGNMIPAKNRADLIEYFLNSDNLSLYMDLKADVQKKK